MQRLKNKREVEDIRSYLKFNLADVELIYTGDWTKTPLDLDGRPLRRQYQFYSFRVCLRNAQGANAVTVRGFCTSFPENKNIALKLYLKKSL